MTNNTRATKVFDSAIDPVLDSNGYSYEKVQLKDVIFSSDRPRFCRAIQSKHTATTSACYLASIKWQASSGTTDEKVPYEVIKLVDAIIKSSGKYTGGYLILGGDGWSKDHLDLYKKGELKNYIAGAESIKIVTLDEFLHLISNSGV